MFLCWKCQCQSRRFQQVARPDHGPREHGAARHAENLPEKEVHHNM
jgi:hypothetical protein